MRQLSSRKKSSTRDEVAPANESPAQKSKKTPAKKRGASARNNEGSDEDTSNTFEVDCVVGSRIIHGQQQYKIHWKGYPSSKDTWELETNLNCPELVKKYLQEVEKEELDESEDKGQSGTKRKTPQPKGRPTKKSKDNVQSNGDEASSSNAKAEEKPKKKSVAKDQPPSDEGKPDDEGSSAKAKAEEKPKKKSEAKDPPASEDDDEEEGDKEEYEVEQIVDVDVDSKGKRSFLVRWKGYDASDDTWEPESNLDCRRLIEEYLTSNPILDDDNVNKKTRVNPRKSAGFPVSPTGKRHSKRSHGRNRTTYFDQE